MEENVTISSTFPLSDRILELFKYTYADSVENSLTGIYLYHCGIFYKKSSNFHLFIRLFIHSDYRRTSVLYKIHQIQNTSNLLEITQLKRYMVYELIKTNCIKIDGRRMAKLISSQSYKV